MDQKTLDLIKAQVEEVQAQFPDFQLVLESGQLKARGTLSFDIEHENRRVHDKFSVRLHFPANYPSSLPFVWEDDGRIPSDFKHFMKAGNLCLGPPVELKQKFAAHQNLLIFLKEQVIPYLFSYAFKREHGTMPFGELDHGYIGLLPYYQERFQTQLVPTLKLLKSLADDFMPPEGRCACGRDTTFRLCHGPLLSELKAHQSSKDFEAELRGMLRLLQTPEFIKFLADSNIVIPMRSVTPKRVLRRMDRKSRRKH